MATSEQEFLPLNCLLQSELRLGTPLIQITHYVVIHICLGHLVVVLCFFIVTNLVHDRSNVGQTNATLFVVLIKFAKNVVRF